MESAEFLLKWNNYQSTLSHIFTRWWKTGSFVDCTLVVERREIRCHRFVLSACSTFFESLLIAHNAHPHPLIILFDVSYDAVYSLLEFMYNGEVHVNKEMLSAVVKAAGSLKIKGISDSTEVADFSKRYLNPVEKQYPIPLPNHLPLSLPNMTNNQLSTAIAVARNIGYINGRIATNNSNSALPVIAAPPLKKRRRVEEALPLSPPVSSGESHNSDQNRVSPACQTTDIVKEEQDDEASDIELQIDESASASTSSASPRSSNTPGMDVDHQDFVERLESAQSLASLATHGAAFHLMQEQGLSPQISNNNSLLLNGNCGMKKVKIEPKNHVRKYTNEHLQTAVEAVIVTHMAPAKAIAIYNIPRRTFFRKLATERKLRGIPSSRDNGSEAYQSSPRSRSPTVENPVPLIGPGNLTVMKNIHDQAKKIADFKNLLTANNDQKYELAQQYFKSLTERCKQKENEGGINDMRPTDSVSSSNSSEKPLGEKNGYDN